MHFKLYWRAFCLRRSRKEGNGMRLIDGRKINITKLIYFFSALFGILFVSCSGDDTTLPIPPAPQPPAISITSPTANAKVAGPIVVSALTTNILGIAKVEFYVDGNLIGTVTRGPFSVIWDTSTVARGSHSLISKAYDSANNAITSAAITIKVTAPEQATLTVYIPNRTFPVTDLKLYIDSFVKTVNPGSRVSKNVVVGYHSVLACGGTFCDYVCAAKQSVVINGRLELLVGGGGLTVSLDDCLWE